MQTEYVNFNAHQSEDKTFLWQYDLFIFIYYSLQVAWFTMMLCVFVISVNVYMFYRRHEFSIKPLPGLLGLTDLYRFHTI